MCRSEKTESYPTDQQVGMNKVCAVAVAVADLHILEIILCHISWKNPIKLYSF